MKVVVICPTYNESKNILELISRILSLPIDIDILIVDDNSPDKTADIVKKMQLKSDKIHLLNRINKEGLGKAYCAGFEWALINKYDKILQMDADLSHNPNDILKLLDSSKKFDLVIITGVLSHQSQNILKKIYKKIYKLTSKYIYLADYFNPYPHEVKYRGFNDRLTKRDFAKEIWKMYPNLKLLDYGFYWKQDPHLKGQCDDVNWFLFKKNK